MADRVTPSQLRARNLDYPDAAFHRPQLYPRMNEIMPGPQLTCYGPDERIFQLQKEHFVLLPLNVALFAKR
jgi:hypothetical protein